MKKTTKPRPASLKEFQNALDRQEAYAKYGFTTEAEIKALQEKEDTDAAVAAYDAAALAEAEGATPSAAPSSTFRQLKAKRAERKAAAAESAARIAQAQAETQATVATGTCPTCGSGLKRNLSIAGWWQCEQLGAETHRKNPALPSCSFQGFTC